MSIPAEASHRKSDPWVLRALVDHCTTPLAYLDLAFRYVRVNAAFAELCQTTGELLVGKSHFRVFGCPEDEALFARARDTGETQVRAERPSVAPDASGRFAGCCNWTLTPVKGSGGAVEGLVLSLRDVTAEVDARRDIAESQTRFRLLFEHMLDGVAYCRMIFDEDGRADDFVYLDVNPAFARLTGLEEVKGRRVSELIPGIREAHPELLELYGRVVSTGRSERTEIHLAFLDSWLSISVYSPERDHFVAVFEDVTERHRAEEALRKGAALHRTLIETTRLGYWLTDLDGTLLEANEAYARLSGFAQGELQGLRISDLEARETPEETALHIQLLRQGGNHCFETVHRRKDGTFFDVEIRTTYLDVDGGRLMVFIADITERKAAERALREADRHKDEFLALLAHELRNPLTPILYSVHLLRRAGDVQLMERAVSIVEKQVHHMVRLIDDLLDVSRISRGKIVLKCEPILLSAVVESAVETCQPLIDAHHHELTLDLPAEPVRLVADKTRLAQVLANLLNNAAKYSPPRSPLSVQASVEEGRVVLRVRDRGIGISSEVLPRVFGLFVQGDSSLVRERGGLGVGLALSKSLVELHGGSIAVTSPGVGLGTEVVLRLPLEGGAPSTSESSPAGFSTSPGVSRRGAAGGGSGAGALHILIVDDNGDLAESTGALLATMGHEIRIANDGPSALAIAAEMSPDVVLLDLGMPRMSGFEVARCLRRSAFGDRALLVAVTGWGQDEDRRRTREAGFDHHLIKPVDPEQLERILGALAPSAER
jgi:PAS domain S-box-containing protein